MLQCDVEDDVLQYCIKLLVLTVRAAALPWPGPTCAYVLGECGQHRCTSRLPFAAEKKRWGVFVVKSLQCAEKGSVWSHFLVN